MVLHLVVSCLITAAHAPQLPSPAPKKKGLLPSFSLKNKSHKDGDKRKKNKSTSDANEIDISKRPPCPLPPSTLPTKRAPEYDEVRNLDVNRVPDLITTLQNIEPELERCECGLTMSEAELPLEWSMHISHDPHTQGRLFFMGPGSVTKWDLPLEVSLELTPDDQDRIKHVKGKCANLQMQYKQQQLQASPLSAVRQLSGADAAHSSSGSSSDSRHRSTSFASDPQTATNSYFHQTNNQVVPNQPFIVDDPADMQLPSNGGRSMRSPSGTSYTLPVSNSSRSNTPISDTSTPSFNAPPLPSDAHRQAVQHGQSGSSRSTGSMT